jgi:hypothetical protein
VKRCLKSGNGQLTESIVYRKHLDVVELREMAFTAGQKAARARLLAALSAGQPAVFEEEAASLEAKAAELQRRMGRLEAKLDRLVVETPRFSRALS